MAFILGILPHWNLCLRPYEKLSPLGIIEGFLIKTFVIKAFLIQAFGTKSSHMGNLNFKTVPVLLSVIFPFHFVSFPVHPTGFSFCCFTGFLAISYLVIEQQLYCRNVQRVSCRPLRLWLLFLFPDMHVEILLRKI